MPITYNETKKIITLSTDKTTYQMKIDKYGVLLHLYYGKKLTGDAEHLVAYYNRGFCGNPDEAGRDRTYSLDVLPQEYPTFGSGDYRNTALNIQNSDGSEACELRYVSHKITEGKYSLEGLPAVYAQKDEAQTLEILMKDKVTGVQVKLLYGVLPKLDIITRSAVIINSSDSVITIEKAASASVDLLYGNYDMISFHGRHALERMFERNTIGHATSAIGSRRGASSHHYNPAVIIADAKATEESGNCYGMMFVYSGNFLCEAEKDQTGLTRVIMGLQSDLFHYELKQGEAFYVPETVMSFSSEGLGGLSKNYHDCVREHIIRQNALSKERLVLINSWEAAYFDFNGDKILQLAKDAKELGIDMVVMDDGWFGARNDDNTSLGDWGVNEEKLGCSLGELVKNINEQGVKFGIWIEPEMVSEDSELYRAHPDWAIQIPGRKPNRSRNQLVLDFSREDVREHIFTQICDMLAQGNIEYIKWDMNRSLSDIYSKQTLPGKVTYDYVLGVYDFLQKLRDRYPETLIEGCSGGGGRFDAGMLYYTPQIWCSDNTDAINRLKIQYGTSFFYPVQSMGSHVSAVPNHQTGRSVSMSTRGVVAMSGTFGYELDPGKLSDEEKREVREQIAEFKQYSELIHKGDYYRLSSPFEDSFTAWEFVAKDQSRMLLNVVITERYGNEEVTYVKCRGLKEEGIYVEKESGQKYTGSMLMEAGIPMPVRMIEYPAYQMEFCIQ